MKSVFIGGSRKLARLNEQIRGKLAEITERKLHVVVGDANGADRAVQAQLRALRISAQVDHPFRSMLITCFGPS